MKDAEKKLPVSLEKVQSKFTSRRAQKSGRVRIPEELWNDAVCACKGTIVPRDFHSILLQNRYLRPWISLSPFCPLSAIIAVSNWLSIYLGGA